jgi:3-oxoacyl-[acyl-carrier protein] reductase
VLFNHSTRVYYFGALAGKRNELKFDPELLFIGAMFHDMGLAGRYRSKRDRFEVDGANTARAFLRQHKISEQEIEIVWTAIALHTTPRIPQHMHPVVALVTAGVETDVLGIGYSEFSEADREAVVRAFPRTKNFTASLLENWIDEAQSAHGFSMRPSATKRRAEGELVMSTATNKTAIVIGATGGIGRAVALRLAKDGFAITAAYAGNAARADEIMTAIKSIGGAAIAVKADVSSASEVELLFKTALDEFGRIDVVVHTAGVMPMGKIADADLEAFDRVIATNLRGTFLVLSQAARHVSEGGRILAFSSSVLAKSFPGYGAYCASKGGVEALVRVLTNELRGRNITVNAVAAGTNRHGIVSQGQIAVAHR